jgi:hypothetical protein
MTDGDVHFVNARGCFGGNTQTKVARPSHLASRFTRQPNNPDVILASRLNRAQES